MAKDLVKKNQSSMQVLKTLLVLLEGNYTMQDLVEKLNEKEDEPVFNSSVVSKYINTCRHCGIEIIKVHNKYFVVSMPFGMDLTSKELDLFISMQEVAKNNFSVRVNKAFDKLISNISKYSNKRIARVEKKSANITYEMFETAVDEKRKVVLMFKAKAVLECIPLGIVTTNGKVYFHVLADNKEKMILVDRVAGIEVLDVKFYPNYADRSFVYKLTGGLASRYTLREHEVMLTNALPDYIVISNKGEPLEILISRLMRYDKDCEFISPAEYRNSMIEMIDKTLANYGV